jgi:hypothetical protein
LTTDSLTTFAVEPNEMAFHDLEELSLQFWQELHRLRETISLHRERFELYVFQELVTPLETANQF